MARVYFNPETQESATKFVLDNFGTPRTDEELKAVGWYPVEFDYVNYNQDIEKIVPQGAYEWDEYRQAYVQKFEVIALNEDELAGVQQRKLVEAEGFMKECRNKFLAETDYLLMSDYPLSEENRRELEAYRQALRDLPSLEGAPWLNQPVPWPEKPEFLK